MKFKFPRLWGSNFRRTTKVAAQNPAKIAKLWARVSKGYSVVKQKIISVSYLRLLAILSILLLVYGSYVAWVSLWKEYTQTDLWKQEGRRKDEDDKPFSYTDDYLDIS